MTAVRPSPELTPSALDRPRWRLAPVDFVTLTGLAIVTLAVYAPTRTAQFVRYDDPLYVGANWEVQRGLTWHGLRYALTAVVSSNWHPLTLVVEMAVVQLFGSTAVPFHLLNDVLHAANVCLLYLFLRLATGRPGRAAAVAALWGWHPLRVESVAWVGELKDVLCGFFWLGTMLAFLWYRRRPGAGRYLAVLAGMVAAGLSKPMAVTLPLALLLLDYWPLGVGWGPETIGRAEGPVDATPVPARWWRGRILEQLPLLVVSVAVAAACVRTQGETGAIAKLSRFPIGTRLANALDACRMYLTQTVWPTGMAFFYPHPAVIGRGVPALHWLAGGALVVGLSALVLWGRARRPYAVVGWFWFLVTLVPVIGLVQVGLMSRADRYTYLPSIGLVVAVVWAAADGLAAVTATARTRVTGSVAAAAVTAGVAAALLVVTARTVGYWHDNRALAARAAAVVPDNFLALSSLALEDVAADRPAEAVGYARRAVELAPEVQETHHAYALALEADAQPRAAFDEFVQAVRADPDDAHIRNDFGGLLLEIHRDDDAMAQFRRALGIDPNLMDAHLNLGVMLAGRHDLAGALSEFGRAVDLNPRFGPSQGDLADALQHNGDTDEAIVHYRLAVTAPDGPDERPATRTQLAWLTAIDGRSSQADLTFVAPLVKQACDDPTAGQQPLPWYADSIVLARLDRYDDAIAAGEKALQLARSTGQTAMATAIDQRLGAYRQGLPATRPASTQPTPTQPASKPAG